MTKVLPPNELIKSSRVFSASYGPVNHTNKTGANYAQYTINYDFGGKVPDIITVVNNSVNSLLVEDYHWHTSVNQHYGFRPVVMTETYSQVRVYNLNTSSTRSITLTAYFIFTEEEMLLYDQA